MKVKLVGAGTIFYSGRVIKKGEVFEMKPEDVKKYRGIVQVIEVPKKKKRREEGE